MKFRHLHSIKEVPYGLFTLHVQLDFTIGGYFPSTKKIEKDTRVYTWKHSFFLRVIDAIIMSLAPSTKDTFAKRRGLTTSVDGAHFHSNSAKLLAKEVEKHLLKIRV